MKRFLKIFCIWSAIGILLAISLDLMISSGLRKLDQRKYSTWNDIYKGGLKSDVVILGSSRTWCGYNTYIIDSMLNCNSYNLGIDGHQIDFQIIRYETYARYNTKPQTILVNTEFLSTLSIAADKPYEREQFFPYFFDDILIDAVSSAKRITIFDRYLPLFRYYGYREEFENGMASFFGKKDFVDGGMYKGYRGNEYGWDRGSLSRDTLFTANVDWKAVELLDSFARGSIKDGQNVVFVKSPVYFPLREKFVNIEQSDSIFEAISKKYDIPILDYYFSTVCMDSTNFYNPGHLNKKGSELFTIELCKDLDSLGIIRHNKSL
jgi:hypothetical protein